MTKYIYHLVNLYSLHVYYLNQPIILFAKVNSAISGLPHGPYTVKYLNPVVTGEKREIFALSEADAGSDIMSMKTNAKKDGKDWIMNGSKHFVSGPVMADFAIVFAKTGVDKTANGPRSRITAFLVDVREKGFDIDIGYQCTS